MITYFKMKFKYILGVILLFAISIVAIKFYVNINDKEVNNVKAKNSNNDKKTDYFEPRSDKNSLLENLENICSNIRNFNSYGSSNASEYIEKKLLEYDYDVTFQDFNIHEQNSKSTLYVEKNSDYLNLNLHNSTPIGRGKNIIAKQKEFNEDKRTIYLTAHYDTTESTTGVIDNGTGTSVLLEVANMLKNFDSNCNIVMIFFDAEEYFRYGSKYFVSTLKNEEKENIIGCINIDMVGEKNAGKIVMKTPTGKMNVLSLTIDNILNNEFKLSHGGSSDDLSFYMGKIPVITFADESPNLNLDKENTQNQIKNVNINELGNLSESIVKSLINLDLSTYFKLSNYSLKIDIQNYESIQKEINNFKLTNIKETLIENGFDIKIEYQYQDEKGNKVILSKQNQTFIPKEFYKNFIISKNDSDWCYKLENNSNDKNSELLFKNNNDFVKISGDVSSEEAANFLETYYSNYYKYTFGEKPKFSLVN